MNQEHSKIIAGTALIIFFCVTGAYILTTLMVKNQMYMPLSNIIQRTLQLPFTISVIGYFCVVAIDSLASQEKKSTILMSLIIAVAIILLTGIFWLHFSEG